MPKPKWLHGSAPAESLDPRAQLVYEYLIGRLMLRASGLTDDLPRHSLPPVFEELWIFAAAIVAAGGEKRARQYALSGSVETAGPVDINTGLVEIRTDLVDIKIDLPNGIPAELANDPYRRYGQQLLFAVVENPSKLGKKTRKPRQGMAVLVKYGPLVYARMQSKKEPVNAKSFSTRMTEAVETQYKRALTDPASGWPYKDKAGKAKQLPRTTLWRYLRDSTKWPTDLRSPKPPRYK
jgi:hypothetical protein